MLLPSNLVSKLNCERSGALPTFKIPTNVQVFLSFQSCLLLSGMYKYTAGKQAVTALKSVAQTEGQSKHPQLEFWSMAFCSHPCILELQQLCTFLLHFPLLSIASVKESTGEQAPSNWPTGCSQAVHSYFNEKPDKSYNLPLQSLSRLLPGRCGKDSCKQQFPHRVTVSGSLSEHCLIK